MVSVHIGDDIKLRIKESVNVHCTTIREIIIVFSLSKRTYNFMGSSIMQKTEITSRKIDFDCLQHICVWCTDRALAAVESPTEYVIYYLRIFTYFSKGASPPSPSLSYNYYHVSTWNFANQLKNNEKSILLAHHLVFWKHPAKWNLEIALWFNRFNAWVF